MTFCQDLVWFGWQIGIAAVTLLSLSPFKMEEEHLYALRWKELEMHSLALQNTLHERTWSDERNLMQQELRSLKQNIFLFYVKLRWLLKHWRQGKQMEEEGEDFTEVPPPPHPPQRVHFLCVCFVLDPQALLSLYALHTKSHSVISDGFYQAQSRHGKCNRLSSYIRPRILCCPVASFSESLSLTPLCGKVVRPFLPLLTSEFMHVVTLRSCASLVPPCWFVRPSSETFSLLSISVFVPRC